MQTYTFTEEELTFFISHIAHTVIDDPYINIRQLTNLALTDTAEEFNWHEMDEELNWKFKD